MGLFDIFKNKKKKEEFDFLVVSFSENNLSLVEAKKMFNRLNTTGSNVRINSFHKNVVEVKGKNKKWIPLNVFIDPLNHFIPKGEYKIMIGHKT